MEVSAEDISEKIRHAIDVDLPTKVLVHGFGSDCDHIWVYEMRSALMQVQDCNVGKFKKTAIEKYKNKKNFKSKSYFL